MHSVRDDRPLDPIAVAILREVDRLTTEYNIDYFVVGATARDIMLSHVFGIDTGRATRDVDFAIAIENWDQFESIKHQLQSVDGFHASEKLRQRLYFGGKGNESGYPIDLIPFGGVEQTSNIIAWPPDMAVMMNVVGYAEALNAAELVAVTPDLVIRVASLPGLAILKLFAWLDRGVGNPKDAQDLYFLMQSYAAAGNMDRLYGEEFSILEASGHDPDLAGACLLGKDLANLASQQTYDQYVAVLNNHSHVERLIMHMARSTGSAENALSRVERQLEQFKTGIKMRKMSSAA